MKIYGYCEQDNGITCPGNYADMDGCFEGVCSAGQIGGEDADLSGTAICLGDFDGVHKGHMRLFELAKSCGKWGVLLLNRQERQGVLTTLSERLDIIEALGADYAVIAEFSRGFAEKSPEEFADLLLRTLKIGTAVVGYDYRFGHKALGDAQRLKELLKDRAEVIVADAVTCCGQPIKSTKIRELIKNGDLTAASALMGRNYPVKAVIASGKQNGRRLGFPTANFDVSPDKILPPDGVYYG
ncbi:MAG: riboflavin kinase, partial [Clostridiales bacterium]|nr:riboflavin kinase [Clostridiales bacterium]